MDPVETRIITLRGRRVILDADLARIYGVPTKRFNEAIKRNRRRFPSDFASRLSAKEAINLRSQFATSSSQVLLEAEVLSEAPAASTDDLHGGRRYLPGPSPSTAR